MAKEEVNGPSQGIVDIGENPIVDQNGKQITTKSALSKVYQYLRNSQHGDSHDGQTTIPLWTILKAAYEIRNGVAHEGAFNIDREANPGSAKAFAIEQRKQPWDQVYGTLKTAVWLSILRKIN